MDEAPTAGPVGQFRRFAPWHNNCIPYRPPGRCHKRNRLGWPARELAAGAAEFHRQPIRIVRTAVDNGGHQFGVRFPCDDRTRVRTFGVV